MAREENHMIPMKMRTLQQEFIMKRPAVNIEQLGEHALFNRWLETNINKDWRLPSSHEEERGPGTLSSGFLTTKCLETFHSPKASADITIASKTEDGMF